MNAHARELRDQLLALPGDQLSEVLGDVIAAIDDRPVDDDQDDVDARWADEIARRSAEIDSGAVTLETWDGFLDKVAASRRR